MSAEPGGGARAPDTEPLSVRIPDAVRLTGLSRSHLYLLMAAGEIEFVKIGRSTLIPYDALRAFLDSKREGRRPGEGREQS